MPSVLWKLLLLAVLVGLGSSATVYVLAQPAAPLVGGDGSAPTPGVSGRTVINSLDDSPFLTEPRTVEEFFKASLTSLRLSRPALARKYLEGMMALSPDDEALLALRDKHGPGAFLRLANQPELRPLSVQLLDRVNAAFRKRGADPTRIDAMIADLSGTAVQRDIATTTLKSAGAVVIPRMLQILADPAARDRRQVLIETMARMGPPIIPPLLGAIDADDPELKATVIQMLGLLGDRKTASHLWYSAYGPDQPPGVRMSARSALQRLLGSSPEAVNRTTPASAAAELKRVASEYYRREIEPTTNEEGNVDWWNWSPAERTVVKNSMTPEGASLFLGTRFARQSLLLAPEQADTQALFLSLALSSDAHRAGWDAPLPTGPGTAHDVALASGADAVSAALLKSLDSGHPRGAAAALGVLSQVATRHQLMKTGAQQAPISASLNYPDTRVQFAAALAALQLEPESPFPGSERVVAILARALNDTGKRHALVTHASVEKAAAVAGLLGDLGYDPRIARTGREAFRIASEEADVELIVLDLNTIVWDLSQTVANLRADARTASIPIAIYGPDSRRNEVFRLLQRYPLTTYLTESSTAGNLQIQLDPFLARLKSPAISSEVRVEQAAQAAYWLAHIADGNRRKVFNLPAAEKALIRSANDPANAENVLRALGGIPSAAAQEQLQVSACSAQAPPAVRETAAIQLAFHIQRYGLLLSTDEVFAVEKAWKGETEPAVSTALAAVVGTLKPNPQRVSGRLREFEQSRAGKPAAAPTPMPPAPMPPAAPAPMPPME